MAQMCDQCPRYISHVSGGQKERLSTTHDKSLQSPFSSNPHNLPLVTIHAVFMFDLSF